MWSLCGNTFSSHDVVQGALVRRTVAEFICRDHSDWSNESYICQADLSKYRSLYVHSLLESEKGELSSLDNEVFESLKEHELISSNVDAEFSQDWTLGGRETHFNWSDSITIDQNRALKERKKKRRKFRLAINADAAAVNINQRLLFGEIQQAGSITVFSGLNAKFCNNRMLSQTSELFCQQ